MYHPVGLMEKRMGGTLIHPKVMLILAAIKVNNSD